MKDVLDILRQFVSEDDLSKLLYALEASRTAHTNIRFAQIIGTLRRAAGLADPAKPPRGALLELCEQEQNNADHDQESGR